MTLFDPVEAGNYFSADGWVKSFRSDNNNSNCVEWNATGELVGLRDSNHPNGPVLGFNPTQWADFQDAVAARTMHE